MTNPPATPPTPMPSSTPPSGGMPKWVIIVVVAILVIIVGCCGGVYMCTRIVGNAARSGAAALQAEAERQAAMARERAAAGGDAETIPPAGGNDQPPADGGNAGEGNAAGGNTNQRTIAQELGTGRLPVNFPKDLPVMKGLTSSGISAADKVKGNGTATFTGTMSRDQVVNYYESEMPKQGWKLESNQDFGEMSSMSFTKDKLKASIMVTPDSDKKSSVVIMSYETQQ